MKTLHGFDGSCFRNLTPAHYVSVGIFQILPTKDGQRTKRGPVLVRVFGPASKLEAVRVKAREIMDQLDAGTYTGPKNVRVK